MIRENKAWKNLLAYCEDNNITKISIFVSEYCTGLNAIELLPLKTRSRVLLLWRDDFLKNAEQYFFRYIPTYQQRNLKCTLHTFYKEKVRRMRKKK